MCNFLSAIVMRPLGDAELIIHDCTDYKNSHSACEKALGLPAQRDENWAKVELEAPYLPDTAPESWQFVVDEERTPAWIDEDLLIRVKDRLIELAHKRLRDWTERGAWYGSLYCRSYTGDLSALASVGGDLYCEGYTGDLSALTSVGGDLDCRDYTGDLSALASVGGDLDCRDYTGDLSALASVGGHLDCNGYQGDLSALTSVGGYLYCNGYQGDLSALTSVGGDLYCDDERRDSLMAQLGGAA